MNPDLSKYSDLKICVAVSGGKDSMALLHYLFTNGAKFGITLSALNCDHKMRGEASARDSAFVKEYCANIGIPLISYEWDTSEEAGFKKSETLARMWRLKCYIDATKTKRLPDGTQWQGVDAVATAHHLNDNAETVLFNLARGAYLSGLDGITDISVSGVDGGKWNEIRPLITCTREEIDAYVMENGIPYVEDETNFTDLYTRNKIRRHVLPELEKAVPGAAKAIYRFSRLAADDEDYFDRLIKKLDLIKMTPLGAEIKHCEEKVVFKRAALKALCGFGNVKDYTSEHAERLYGLQFAGIGKKFEFLGYVALKEEGKIALCHKSLLEEADLGRPLKCHYGDNADLYMNSYVRIVDGDELEEAQAMIREHTDNAGLPRSVKILKFDYGKIPENAVIRFMKKGDKFTKFGGGTKNLGDYFTDKKIPIRIRKNIPLIAEGSDILAVCGVEISDKIKITRETDKVLYIISDDYALTGGKNERHN